MGRRGILVTMGLQKIGETEHFIIMGGSSGALFKPKNPTAKKQREVKRVVRDLGKLMPKSETRLN